MESVGLTLSISLCKSSGMISLCELRSLILPQNPTLSAEAGDSLTAPAASFLHFK